MKPNAVVFGAVSIMDISDSTVTPETLGEGATAYDKSGEKITGTMKSGIDTSDATATAADIVSGATAYVNGEKITGTIKKAYGGITGYVTAQKASGSAPYVQMRHTVSEPTVVAPSTGGHINLQAPLTDFGDATAEDVAAGKTFTSADGFVVTGTHECEAGLDTSDATATASDILSGKTAYVNGSKVTGNIATKTSSDIVIAAATVFVNPGYYATQTSKSISTVSLAAPSISVDTAGLITATTTQSKGGYVTAGSKATDTKQLTTQAAKTITPSESSQTAVASGIYTTGAVTVAPIPSNYITTDDATAAASDILSGKTAYVNGGKVTGSIPSFDAMTITPDAEGMTIGKGHYLNGHLVIEGDSNLVSENIKSGVSIFGVAGSYDGEGGSGSPVETFHVTSTTQTISPTKTGTVKVWGYGLKSTSTWSKTAYSFVGDGYYSGTTGTKTSATFTISNGVLSGLPSGLTVIDVLVTIGI